jgi:hypothetical protein
MLKYFIDQVLTVLTDGSIIVVMRAVGEVFVV